MKKLVILFLYLQPFVFYSQNLEHANSLFERMEYFESARVYEDYLAKSDILDINAIKKAGDSNYFLNRSKKSEKWYEQLYNIQGKNIEDKYFFRYLQSLRSNGNYEKADRLTKVYLQKKNNPEEIERFKIQKEWLDSIQQEESAYSIRNLEINSESSDFGAAFYGDKVVYSSTKSSSGRLYSWNKQPFLDLYVAERSENGSLLKGRSFMPDLTSRYHDATLSFSKTLDTIYYTTNVINNRRLLQKESEVNNFHIIRGILRNGEVEKTEGMAFNSKNYSVGHPSLGDNGKFLFFASDMPGGYGETDLYFVEIFPDGSTSNPKNLGNKINTEGREMFPFYMDNTLYFSSDGHFGLGGLDILSSKRDKNFLFSIPRNLGPPVNSNKDDFSFILDPVSGEGYMSSNRKEGKGDDDIYYINRKCKQVIRGKVTDSINQTPIRNASLTIFDEFDDEIGRSESNSLGEYSVQLPCNMKFSFKVSKDAYTSSVKYIQTRDIHNDTLEGFDFALASFNDLIEKEDMEEKIKVEPIFFNFNKSDITAAGAKELDKVIYVMQQFPAIKIKIESHTDSRGSDAFNLKLSQDRANATKKYLLSKGIPLDRIASVKGYGEIEIKNECIDGVECEEEYHQVNRRSDFIIVPNPQVTNLP